MTQRREPFVKWPGWEHLRFFVLLAGAQTIWFGFVFGGCDYLTSMRSDRTPVHFELELELPFVPEMSIAYMSIYGLLWIAPFVLRSRQQLRALAVTLAFLTLCGGVCFLVLPAELAYPPPHDFGRWPQLFHFADWLNLKYNLVPSLHVAFSVACVAAYSALASRIGKAVLWSWAGVISVSTLLTHQHHIADVITGFLLGLIAARLVYNRLASKEL